MKPTDVLLLACAGVSIIDLLTGAYWWAFVCAFFGAANIVIDEMLSR